MQLNVAKLTQAVMANSITVFIFTTEDTEITEGSPLYALRLCSCPACVN